jgi:aldose 1-epimerase
MLYHIDTEERTVGGHSSTVYTLSRRDTGSLAEIWPAFGFNCVRWHADRHELLYHAPDWAESPIPTRSGIPILFPFPNRIRDGSFTFEGREYHLPKNDGPKTNAIHGFTPRNPWRIFGYGTDLESAWLHADFEIPQDLPDASNLWPGSARFSVCYRLKADRLRMEMQVHNTGDGPFPFGVGLHPYFQLPWAHDASNFLLHAPARSIWSLKDTMPTGEKEPVPDSLNWNRPRLIGAANIDTVYGDLGVIHEGSDGLLLRATIADANRPGRIELLTSPEFRESVVFVPPHRRAVCVEPYTCVTDAVNLQARGVDAGWRELAAGQRWSGVVEFRWNGTE